MAVRDDVEAEFEKETLIIAVVGLMFLAHLDYCQYTSSWAVQETAVATSLRRCVDVGGRAILCRNIIAHDAVRRFNVSCEERINLPTNQDHRSIFHIL